MISIAFLYKNLIIKLPLIYEDQVKSQSSVHTSLGRTISFST